MTLPRLRAREFFFWCGCLVVLAAVVFSPQPAHAATPSSGTISTATPNLSWCGSTGCSALINSVSSSPLSADCSNSTCDVYTLTVGRVSENAQIAVQIQWTNPANDFDLHVYDASGNELCSSTGAAPSTSEQCTIPASPGCTR